MSLKLKSRHGASGGTTEFLEHRRLLAGQSVAVNVEYSPALPYVAGLIDYRIPTGFQTTVSGGVGRAAVPGETPAPDGTQITGSVSIGWYQGPVIATLSLQDSDFTDPDPGAGFTSALITLNEADAGTPIASGPYAGDHVLMATYSGDGNFNATTPVDYTSYLSDLGSEALSYGVDVIRFTGGISFKQEPTDTESGEAIKPPIEVSIMNQQGGIDTSSSDQVQLSVASGPGALAGTLTARAVHGVAIFKNVSANTGGSYTLTAKDLGNGDISTSSAFTVSPGKLEFLKQPSAISVTEPVTPAVKVELKNGRNQLVKTSDGTLITLNIVGDTSNDAIANNTATIEGGIATFSDLTFTTPGEYQLQATDGVDTAAMSDDFKVSPLHLAFVKQPKSGKVTTALVFSVAVEDAKNKVLKTDDSTTIEIQVVTLPTGPSTAFNDGVVVTDGEAAITTADALMLYSAGSYDLAAAAIDANGAPLSTVLPIVSKKFTLK